MTTDLSQLTQEDADRYSIHPNRIRNLVRAPSDVMAGWLACQREVTPGVGFARKPDGIEKQRARAAVLHCFSAAEWPKGLSVVTLPGLYWLFERQLLGQREGPRADREQEPIFRPHRTYIEALEREPWIYRSSMLHIPGLHSGVKQFNGRGHITVGTPAIQRYRLLSFEKWVDAPWRKSFDAAWLDFNGPINSQRIEKIVRLWRDLRWRLVLTWLNARHDHAVSESIAEAGGPFEWVLSNLNAVRPTRELHRISYNDSAPMLQLAVEAAA